MGRPELPSLLVLFSLSLRLPPVVCMLVNRLLSDADITVAPDGSGLSFFFCKKIQIPLLLLSDCQTVVRPVSYIILLPCTTHYLKWINDMQLCNGMNGKNSVL